MSLIQAVDYLIEKDSAKIIDYILIFISATTLTLKGIKDSGKRAIVIIPISILSGWYFWREIGADIFSKPAQAHQEVAIPVATTTTLPSSDNCANKQAFDRAKDSGYDTLTMFFSMCPFISEENSSIAELGATAFNEMSEDFIKNKNPELGFEAASRASAIGMALMDYTMLHGGVKDSEGKGFPGNKKILVTISHWPERRAEFSFNR